VLKVNVMPMEVELLLILEMESKLIAIKDKRVLM